MYDPIIIFLIILGLFSLGLAFLFLMLPTEIPSAFVLDLDTGELYIHQSGIYEVFVKVFDSNGNEYPYEFFMPVEVR